MRLPHRLDHGQEVELVGHLEELRSRIFVAGGAILVTTILAFTIHRRVITLLVSQLPPNHRHLLTLGIAEPFTTSLKVSLALGFALALPIVLWQLWSFLAPALDPKVQQGIAGFTVFAAVLMCGGIIFGYEVALPAALHFLTNYDNSVYDVQVRAADFISFAVLVLAACGAVFELPIVVLGLVRVRALTSKKLRGNRKIGYMIVACIGVALPGVDPVTTVMETIPLAILFETSIWLSAIFEKRWFAPLRTAEEI
ncbi:MAG TPA: twin-arginine translocase subunit TatC [Gaiellaceae bacterium]|nr:twin-arginine translocase subunit TatC [Gaiellaceae bacterium]